jgi:hypothetical protein
MKKIITTLSLFSTIFSFGQCVNLYVKKHYSGDPICLLSPGSSLEICEAPGTACNNGGTITGGKCTYYIQNIRMSGDVITYEFGIDECTPYFYAPKYGELMVNTATKMFGFLINGIIGTYSYYNQSEMGTKNAQEKAERDIQSNALEKEKIESDQKLTTEINLAISKKEYFKANQLYKNLNKANSALFNEINTNLTPIKSKMDLLYSKYLSAFNLTKKEYSKNNKDFILKNRENISISSIFLEGKDAYLERIENTTNQSQKKGREEYLEKESYFYENYNGQHFIAPVGVASNYYEGRYNSKIIDEIQLALRYDTISKRYYSCFDFLQKDKMIASGIIVNRNNYNVKKYSMPYPKQLKDLLNVAINQGSNKFVEENYPILTIPLDNIESIPFNSLKKSSNPGEGLKNDQYEEFQKKFKEINMLTKITKIETDKSIIVTENFYNPSYLYLIKKMYPNADTLIFVKGNHKKDLGKLAIHINSDGINSYGSIVPLQKGIIELKNNKLIVYKKNENYSEYPIQLINESKLSLTKINLENLELDSVFFSKSEINITDKKTTIEQYPISFYKIQLGSESRDLGIDKAEYIYNDSVFIQLLPTYVSETHLSESRFWIDLENKKVEGEYIDDKCTYDLDCLNKFLRFYIVNMTTYFEYKKEGNLEKANKSLLKAEKELESFKSLYFSTKNFY